MKKAVLTPYTFRLTAVFIFGMALLSKVVFFISHVPFSQDQVRDVLFTRHLIETGTIFIPYGPSTSVGTFFLPPLYYYLQLLAQSLLFNQFFAMDVMVMIIESITPVLIFFIMTKITKAYIPAVGSALIYMLAVGTLIATGAWNPNLVPFCSTLFLVSVCCYILDRRPAWLVGSFVSIFILINLHFQWFVLAPIALAVSVHAVWQWRRTWKYLVISAVVGVLIFSPYLIQENQTGWPNTQAAMGLLQSQTTVYERVRKPVYVLFFYPNFYQRMQVGSLFIESWDKQYEVFEIPTIIATVIFFSILAVCMSMAWVQGRTHKNYYLALYLVFFLSMAFFLRFYKGDKPDYYLYIFVSLWPVFLGSAIYWLTKTRKTATQLLPFALILAMQGFAVAMIPTHNAYQEYKVITDVIQEKATEGSVLVVPTNQELVQPLSYFLDTSFFDLTQKDTARYVVLFCYTNQRCQDFRPNLMSAQHLFKYNHVDPVDFSYRWPNPNTEQLFSMSEGDFSAVFIQTTQD